MLFGKSLDDPDALGVLPHHPDHVVHRSLHPGKQRYAVAGDEEDQREHHGHDGQHDGSQRPVHEQGNAHAAHQKDGGAHAHTLHHIDKVMDIIGVGGQAGLQRGDAELVRLGRGQVEGAPEQIVADDSGGIPAHRGGHAVGDHVHGNGQRRAQQHYTAPHEDLVQGLAGDHDLEHMAENVGQQQFNQGTADLDGKAQQHAPAKRLEISKQQVHLFVTTFGWVNVFAKNVILSWNSIIQLEGINNTKCI